MLVFVIAAILAMPNMNLGQPEHNETTGLEKKLLVRLSTQNAMLIIPEVTKCMDETELNFDALSEIKEGKENGDKKVDDFLKCSFRSTRYADSKGDVDIEKFMNLFPNIKQKGAIRKAVEECNELKSKNVGNKLRLFMICFMRKSPAMIIL